MSDALGLNAGFAAEVAGVADMIGQPAANFGNAGGAYTLGVDTGASSFGDSGGGIGGAVAGIAAAIGAALGGGPGDGGGPAPE